MDGQCQDEFLHRTDPGREQERINVTFRSVGSNNTLPPLLCSGQEWHVVCQRVRRVHQFVRRVHQFLLWGTLGMAFLVLWASRWCLVHMGSASFASLPVVYKAWIKSVCLLLWGECLAAHKTACMYLGMHELFTKREPYMLASAGQPSLHGYNACYGLLD